ncbi:exlusion protein FxsA [Archangium sp. Cb G35]|uniref:FxsA family protein n=1 Tax=Archangium sp. Cb G35 TaxID=1920190 RepID=UPI000936BD21|nr:FxsA family protein [Archangium sp. Cb G35]OJT27062.1 exlusion protein FxsA [Archangium sp. Cb G35]
MFKYLLLAFTVVPFIELYLLLAIGREVGFWPTVAGVLFTGVVGAWLAKKEGLRVLRRWQESLARGRMPDEGLVGGVLVLVGGVLLVSPGVFTDVVGLFLLFPPTRRLVAELVRRRLERRMAEGTLRVTTFQSGPFPGGPFGSPSGDQPHVPRASRPRIERKPGDETDAEFTE